MDNTDNEIGRFGYYVTDRPNEIAIMVTLPRLLDNPDETEGMTSDEQFENLSLLDCFRLLNRGWHVLISSTVMWGSLRLARLDFRNRNSLHQF